jgi:hypothetical protein
MFNENLRMSVLNKGRVGTTSLNITCILDYDEGNGVTFTEAGLFYPSDTDDTMFQRDEYWSDHPYEYDGVFRGNAEFRKLATPRTTDCDVMSAHTMFGSSWSKTSAERAEVSYVLNMSW